MRVALIALALSFAGCGAAFADDKKPVPPKGSTTGGSVHPDCNSPSNKMKTACTNMEQVKTLLKEEPPPPPAGKPIPYPNTGATTTAPVSRAPN